MDRLYFLFIFASLVNIHSGVRAIGVNYGLVTDNLPPSNQVVTHLQSIHINKIRIFEPNPNVLNALRGSNIGVILGTRNEDLEQLSGDPSFATTWVDNNVVPYASDVSFTLITAGNEVIPGPSSTYVLGAIQNLANALKSASIIIPVSTVFSAEVLGESYPPSTGTFCEDTISVIQPIVDYFASEKVPFLVNLYPYFAYVGDPVNIKLDFALSSGTAEGFDDGPLHYGNLLDSMVDATYSALEKSGGSDVEVIVSETGWPSAGNGNTTTKENAQAYNNNLIKHVGQGTPKKPGKALEAYVFALFNEDLKPPGVEQNFGLYYPDLTEVYHVNFS